MTAATGGVTKRLYRDELEAELNGAPDPNSLSLNDKWKRMVTSIRKVTEKTIGYTRRQARSKWFDVECGVVNDETEVFV
jgi:hypothetical protein